MVKKPNYVYLEYDYQLLRVVLANFCYNGYAFDYDNGIIEDGTIDYCSVAFTNRPKIVITGEGELNSKVTIAIDYTETTVGKQYKIGSGEYIDYTEPFEIESSKELASQRDEHGNLKICAKATIETGESTEICRSINKLDLDYPDTPTIDAAGGYPVITEYGVSSGLLTIEPAPSAEATPYVSFDGTTWIPYEVGMSASGNTIYAKIVKTKSGLESEVTSITTTTPTDAFTGNALDGDRSTYDTVGYYSQKTHDKYIYVDSSMIGKEIFFTVYSGTSTPKAQFLDGEDNVIETYTVPYNSQNVIRDIRTTIPSGTVKIKFYEGSYTFRIYAIGPYTTPGITNTFVYPKLTEYGIEQGYNKINISYVQASEQKLYKIDDGEWQNYTGEIDLPLDHTIYAKGINKYGVETEVSSYTSVLKADAFTRDAYDGDRETYDTPGYYSQKTHDKYIDVDSSMIGKDFVFAVYSGASTPKAQFLDSEGNTIETYTVAYDSKSGTRDIRTTIPTGTVKIKFYEGSYSFKVYEIGPYTTPDITKTFVYPKLTQSGITQGYNKITISYVSASEQKLYKIGDGEWQNYTGEVDLALDQTIYAKGINRYGVETIVSSYTSALKADAFAQAAYDGDNATYDTVGYYSQKKHDKYIYVDLSMIGKNFTFKTYTEVSTPQVQFLDGNDEVLKTYTVPYNPNNIIRDMTTSIPEGTVKIKFYEGSYTYRIYEIWPSD